MPTIAVVAAFLVPAQASASSTTSVTEDTTIGTFTTTTTVVRNGVGIQSISQYTNWVGPGNWWGGDVTEVFDLTDTAVWHHYTTCNRYSVPGTSVNIDWCGATGSGTATLTSGANFTINAWGSTASGGIRQTFNTRAQQSRYCWPQWWVNC